jgi:hypothetical protein
MSKKQAKVFFFREERLPLPLDYLTDKQLVNSLAEALDYTARVAFDLTQAARRTGMILQVADGDSKQWSELNTNAKSAINNWVAHTGVERHYWASLDIPFQSFIINLARQEREAVMRQWFDQLRGSALTAFDQAAHYVGADGRSLKAVVRGQGYLTYRLNQLIAKEEATE